MTCLKKEIQLDIKRWFSYGWEFRIIYKLLHQVYGIELSKIEFLKLSKDCQV